MPSSVRRHISSRFVFLLAHVSIESRRGAISAAWRGRRLTRQPDPRGLGTRGGRAQHGGCLWACGLARRTTWPLCRLLRKLVVVVVMGKGKSRGRVGVAVEGLIIELRRELHDDSRTGIAVRRLIDIGFSGWLTGIGGLGFVCLWCLAGNCSGASRRIPSGSGPSFDPQKVEVKDADSIVGTICRVICPSSCISHRRASSVTSLGRGFACLWTGRD